MIGEVVKFLSRRKIDTALWLAILAPLVPLCLVLPLIQGAHNYSGTFWASPTIANVINSFSAAFGGNSVFFFGVVLVTVLFFSFANQLEAAPLRSLDLSKGDFSRAEIAVVVGFVALPFFGYLLGYFVTRAFWPRYVIASEIGVVIVFATFLNVFCKGLRILQLALLGLAILSVVFHVGKTQTSLLSQRYLIDNEVRTISRYVRTGLPVLIQDIYLFSQLEFYAPADIKAKIFYPINLEASRQYLGHDTIERGLIDLKPFFGADAIFGENSMPYHQFVSEYSEFYAYRSEIDIGMDWLFYKLTEGDFEIRLVKRYGSGLMFKVSRRHI